MTTANKVININFSEGKKRDIVLPELLNSARNIAIKKLGEYMDTMFNNTDDCLFEYADKAANNEQQTVYLHAMREIRLKKSAIKEAFFKDFDLQFLNALGSTANSSRQQDLSLQTDSFSSTGLSLVDEDELEESLAITNMASRVYSECRESLSALIQRMNEIYDAKQFDKETNPLSPEIICNAFSNAVTCLSASLEIKLIFYKLFDKFVVRNMGQLYHHINDMFVAAGVLPTIKYKIPVKRTDSNPTHKAADQVDSFLQELNYLQELDNGQVDTPAGTTSNTEPVIAAQPKHNTNSAVPGDNPNVGNLLEAMRQALDQYRGVSSGESNGESSRHGQLSDSGADNAKSEPGAMATVYPETLSRGGFDSGNSARGEQSAAGSSGAEPAIQGEKALGINPMPEPTGGERSEPVTGDAIYYVTSDVIAGLSRIQNNIGDLSAESEAQNSGEAIKSKVLQVVQDQDRETDKSLNGPDADIIDIVSMMFDYILKDKSLPDRTKGLLARLQIPMVKVAILDKAFFSRKTHPARALLNELANAGGALEGENHDGDNLHEEIKRIVDRILDEFDSNIEFFEQLLTDFRNFQAKEIQANRQAEQIVLDTKQTVAEEIEKRLSHHKVPEAISRFILGPWKDVMTTVGIQDQCEGIAWSSASTFLDDLIWSVQPKRFNDERRQLTMLIPRMLTAMRDGMELLKKHSYDLPGFMETLQKIHLELLHPQTPLTKSSSDQHEGITEATFDDPLLGQASEDGGLALPGDPLNFNDSEDDIILQSDKHESFQFDMADPQLKQSRYFTTVKTMQPGTWVEFKSTEGFKRGRLTWKCDFTGEYTFLDRLYKVVADINMRDLIHRMEDGSAKIVEDIPMFDRAVNAIMSGVNNLRSH